MPDQKNPNIVLESDLPTDLKTIESEAIIPSQQQTPPSAVDSLPPYFRGSIAPTLQHDVSLVKTGINLRQANTPLMPPAPSANPQNNAAIKSIIDINQGSTSTTVSGLRFRGTWNSFTAYSVNDVVIDNNSSYVAIKGSTNIEPDQGNVTVWTLLGKNLNFRGLWTTFNPVRQSNHQVSANGSPSNVSLTSNVVAGNHIFVSVSVQNIGASAAPMVTDTQGNPYTQIFVSPRVDSNEYCIFGYFALIGQSGPLSVNVSYVNGGPPGFDCAEVLELINIGAFDSSGTAGSTGTSGSYPSITVSSSTGGDVIVAAAFADSGGLAAPTGYNSIGPFQDQITAWFFPASVGSNSVQFGGSFNLSGTRFVGGAATFTLANGFAFYNPYDVVEFNGSMYLCVVSTSGSPASSPADWVLFAQSTGLAQVKTGNYLAVSGDEGTLLSFNSSSAVTLTLPTVPPDSGWWLNVENIGTGVLTINPNGLNIDTLPGNLTLTQNQGMAIFTDGTNYFTFRGSSAIGGVSVKTTNYAPVTSDSGTLLSFNGSNLTATLPSPPPNSKWTIFVQNLNSTNLTINPNGLNIDGSGLNLTLGQNQGLMIFTDGTNYFTLHGVNRLTVPSILSATAPDGSGNVTVSLVNQNAKTALMGPVACSAAGTPTFRQPQGTDFVNLNIASASAVAVTTNQSGNLRLCGSVLPAGLYRISMYVVVTTTGSGNISMTITWNDGTASQSFSPSNISTTVLGTIAQFDIVVLSDGIHDITYAVNLI